VGSLTNVRGLGQTDKCDVVRDNVAKNHPQIACLQETKLMDLDARAVRAFLPSALDDYRFTPAVGSRGGILTAWNYSAFTRSNYWSTAYTLTVTLQSTTSDLSFNLTNIYGPANHPQSSAFLDEL